MTIPEPPKGTAPLVAWLFVGHVLLLGVVDLWLGLSADRETITHYLRGLASRHPILAFMFGLIMGHLFWSE